MIVVAITILVPGRAIAQTTLGTVIPYSATEIVNPLRGQHENLKAPLLPQQNPAQSAYAAWPGTDDRSMRYDWSQLQPVDPRTLPSDASDDQKYDFSAIDADIASAAAQGRRFGFRVAMFNSCCDASYPNNTDISVPAWVTTVPGATSTYVHDGISYVIPNWNDAGYLKHVSDLLAALGRHYDGDERLAWFEYSGYGDFSENHNAFMRDTLGIPGPSRDNSINELGYNSPYEDQYITKASVITLTDANLAAFPRTRLVTAPGNAEIVKQAFRDSAQLAGRTTDVGIRSDCLGTYDVIPSWATDVWAYYVQTNDPIIEVIKNRWKSAPIITEWCNFTTETEAQYYDRALTDTVNRHVSILASTGNSFERATTTFPQDLYEKWSRANKYSGYRYAVTAADVPDQALVGVPLAMNVTWTNFGVAPAYEDWRPQYEVRNAAGQVVASIDAGVDLHALAAEQNYTSTAADPIPATTVDNVHIPTVGLTPGQYTVVARVPWNEHKSNGSNTVSYQPMALAETGRDVSGAYPVGAFTLKAPKDTIEAESMTRTVDSSGGTFALSGASNGWVHMLWADGALQITGNTSQVGQVTVVAKGEACNGDPVMSVEIDGSVDGTATVSSQGLRGYSFDLPSPISGNHTLTIRYGNDYADGACDRNLIVDAVMLD
ncbi:carbohydrate-binding domain-containing protein [Tsukamurella sp. 8F]|uniref:carbohydrate-binding domain-containing protein n=1 Tax=unclassified Tsukamurella TaxID=2633480 RepID=UPI0023B9762B|nr:MULTISPECIES: carbohydrate-binding domain-containing protein [unclassified Tsukamurella]MDF0530660.1 carbohydrate-binding domain-containing protein [Tsukamurella sp. 8J]MDF0587861.1 carbohydrate-binding domain-containing protein [Tsukamurella sp. 8F]